MRTGYLSTDRFYFARTLTSAQVGLQLKRSHRPYAGFTAAPLESDDENTASADTASAASELNGLDAQDT